MPDDGENRRSASQKPNSLIERAMRSGQPPHSELSSRDRGVGKETAAPTPGERGLPRADTLAAGQAQLRRSVAQPNDSVAFPPSVDRPKTTDAPARESSRTVEIDFDRLQSMGFISPNTPRTRTTEEFRLIKRTVLQNVSAARRAGAPNANLIMVTSSVPAEGKTFNAINLAISIAQEPDYRALLIDADLLRPAVFGTLGIEPRRGLIDLIENPDEKFSDLLLRTNLEGLSLLCSGTAHPMATELLASERMKTFINEIAQRYTDRIIIFDAPPMLLTSEPTVLASHMAEILFVVEADRTSQAQIREALDLIGPGPNVGIVLNKSRSKFGLRRFGEYYKSYAKSR